MNLKGNQEINTRRVGKNKGRWRNDNYTLKN